MKPENTKTLAVSLILATFVVIGVLFINLNLDPNTDQLVEFSEAGILAPFSNQDQIVDLVLGKSATITVSVKKISDKPVDNLMIKTYLTNSNNGDFLLIDKPTIHPGALTTPEEYTQFNNFKNTKIELFTNGDTTGPITIQVTATNYPGKKFSDSVNVVLFVNNQEMDRKTFDVNIIRTI